MLYAFMQRSQTFFSSSCTHKALTASHAWVVRSIYFHLLLLLSFHNTSSSLLVASQSYLFILFSDVLVLSRTVCVTNGLQLCIGAWQALSWIQSEQVLKSVMRPCLYWPSHSYNGCVILLVHSPFPVFQALCSF